MHSERLYYRDSYLREFEARVVATSADGLTLYLDRTAFYPASGGQPFDTGSIGGVSVVEVADEDGAVAHRVSAPVTVDTVPCRIDWARRFDHMQQHSGQHLLSAVCVELLGAQTVSFHLGDDYATIDLEAGAIDAAALRQAEMRANEIVCENRPLAVSFEDASAAGGLRKPSERSGVLRVVSIDGLDRSACGGTHVRTTGEIGPVLIRKLDRIRNTVRLEFLCGLRAVRRARADYDALSRAAQLFSSPLDAVPDLAAAQLEAARDSERTRRRLEADLARYRGRDLYDRAEPDGSGMRRMVQRLPSGSLEDLRNIAQSFTAQPKAIFAAVLESPPSVLLAVSEDAGIDAGKLIKSAVSAAGGRGGGTPRIAQGSVPAADRLAEVLAKLGL